MKVLLLGPFQPVFVDVMKSGTLSFDLNLRVLFVHERLRSVKGKRRLILKGLEFAIQERIRKDSKSRGTQRCGDS